MQVGIVTARGSRAAAELDEEDELHSHKLLQQSLPRDLALQYNSLTTKASRHTM